MSSSTAVSAPASTTVSPVRAGAWFAGLFVGGLVLAGLLGTGTYPSPLDSEAAAAEYFADNGAVVLVQGLLHFLAALPLALFAGGLTDRRARIAGWGAATALAVSGLINIAIPVLDAGGDTLHALHYGTFLAGGQIHVPLLGVMVLLGVRSLRATAPRWTTVLGAVAGSLAVLSLASFATEAVMLLLPLGRFTSILWITVTAVRAYRGK